MGRRQYQQASCKCLAERWTPLVRDFERGDGCLGCGALMAPLGVFTYTKAPTLAGCPRYRWTYRARLACVRRLCRDLDELSILVVRSLIPVALGLGPQAFGYRNTQCHRCLVPSLFSVCINPAWAYFWQLCVPRGAASLIPNKP